MDHKMRKRTSTLDNINSREASNSNLAQLVEAVKTGHIDEETQNIDFTKRKLSTIIYALILIMTGLVTSPITPIAKTSTKVFDKSLTLVNLTTSIYSFAGLFMGLPANMLIPKIGVRNSTLIATLLFLIGMFIRTLFNKNFLFIHLGQVIAGFGAPFVGNGIAGFANNWYTGSSVRNKYIIEITFLPKFREE